MCYENRTSSLAKDNGAHHPRRSPTEFSTENATGGDSIGLRDSTFQLWMRLLPATSVFQSGYEYPRAAAWTSHCLFNRSECGPIKMPAAAVDTKR